MFIGELIAGDRFGLIPAGAGSQTEFRDRQGMAVGRAGALSQHQSTFVQGEKGQLGFVDTELPQIGERVGLVPNAQADQHVEHSFQIAVFMVDRCRGAALEPFGPVSLPVKCS